MKNFFRKVAYGIGPNEDIPSDPLKWALDQLNDVKELLNSSIFSLSAKLEIE